MNTQSLTQRIMYYQKIGYEVKIIYNSKYILPSELSMKQLASLNYIEKVRPVNMVGKIVKIFYLKEKE